MQAPLPDAALDRLFRTARSANGYTDEPVSEEQIRALYDLVKMGPTSANQSPARFVWCVSREAKERRRTPLQPAQCRAAGRRTTAGAPANMWVCDCGCVRPCSRSPATRIRTHRCAHGRAQVCLRVLVR